MTLDRKLYIVVAPDVYTLGYNKFLFATSVSLFAGKCVQTPRGPFHKGWIWLNRCSQSISVLYSRRCLARLPHSDHQTRWRCPGVGVVIPGVVMVIPASRPPCSPASGRLQCQIARARLCNHQCYCGVCCSCSVCGL